MTVLRIFTFNIALILFEGEIAAIDLLVMNEAQKKQYLELDSLKTETEPTVRDDAVAESSTPGAEAVKKRQASADL